MSERMLAAIRALSKGQRATIPPMQFGQFTGFMEAIRSEQKKVLTH
ncbi:TPA: hypothetical protein U5D50_004254 [Yersinia enterocolitica]|nr:hypothetical protein [Yersinia enterocolitica]